MKYAKPEINILASASRAIQGQSKADTEPNDSFPPDTRVIYTVSAYQSDE